VGGFLITRREEKKPEKKEEGINDYLFFLLGCLAYLPIGR